MTPAVKQLAILALVCLGFSLVSSEGRAQSPTDKPPQFEVASVRATTTGRGGAGSIRKLNPDGLTCLDRPLFDYIQFAYNVAPYQITHGPAISLADRYDIVAKAGERVSPARVRLMLRSLLEDRFKLVTHTEINELSVYVLTVVEGGARFQASTDNGPMDVSISGSSARYVRTSMAYLAGSILSNLPSLGRPVVDRTGLDGSYDFELRLFDPDAPNGETRPKGNLLRQLDGGLNASLRNLGLKLEAEKAPVEILVIDQVEKASEN